MRSNPKSGNIILIIVNSSLVINSLSRIVSILYKIQNYHCNRRTLATRYWPQEANDATHVLLAAAQVDADVR